MRVYKNQCDRLNVQYGHWQGIRIGVDVVFADMRSMADSRMMLKMRDRMKNFYKTEDNRPLDSFERRIYALKRCKRCGICVQDITSDTKARLNLKSGRLEFTTKRCIFSYNVCPMCGELQELCDSLDTGEPINFVGKQTGL